MRQVVADLKPDDARDCCDGAMVLMGITPADRRSELVALDVEFVRGGRLNGCHDRRQQPGEMMRRAVA